MAGILKRVREIKPLSESLFKLALKILNVLTKLERSNGVFMELDFVSVQMKNARNQPFGLNCTGNFLAALLNTFKKIKLCTS